MKSYKTAKQNYSLRIAVTSACNLNCSYCNPNRKISFDKLMSDKDLLEIIEAGVKSNINQIAWTGGEPTVRPNFIKLVKKAKELGIKQQRITTNGVIYYKMAEDLKLAGINQVDISLDTLDKKEFKKICGLDAFDNVMKSINKAVELHPLTKVNTVIFRSNFHTLQDFVDFIESFGGKLSTRISEIVPCGQLYEEDPTQFDRNFVPIHEMLFKFSTLGKLKPIQNRWDLVKSIYFKIEGKKGIYGVLPNHSANYKCDTLGCTKIRISPHGYVSNCTIQLKYLRNFCAKTLNQKIRMMREIVDEKLNRDYTGFRHKQKYYDFWRFGMNSGIEKLLPT